MNCKSAEGVGLTYLAAKKGHVNILEYLKAQKLLEIEQNVNNHY